MPTAHDVAFGRVALAHGLVQQAALTQVYGQLPPGRSLGEVLVQRQLLTVEQARWVQDQVQRQSSGAQPIPNLADSQQTLRTPPSSAGGPIPNLADSQQTLRTPPSSADGPILADSQATVGPGSAGLRQSGSGSGSSLLGRGSGSSSGIMELPEPGDVVAERYQLVSILGRGGMGAVYRARDTQANEDVALKLMLPQADEDGSALARFRREAEAVAKVDAHVGIVRVRQFGSHNGAPFAVQDLVEGRDLHARVKDTGALAIDDALNYTEQASRAIHHCHTLCVLHRDLKPANVLLRDSDQTAHVTDFGLALDEQAERLTKTGEVMGTPAYMPPEQAEGKREEIDALSDVYALGTILYELVTGRPPFEGSQVQVMKKIFMDLPAPLSKHRPGEVTDELEAICRTAMAKEKSDRYPSALALAEDLAALRRGDPISARPPTTWRNYRWKLSRGDPVAWGLLLVPALAVVAVLTAAAYYSLFGAASVFAEALASGELETRLGQDPLLRGDEAGEGQLALFNKLADLAADVDDASPTDRVAFLQNVVDQARAKKEASDAAEILRVAGDATRERIERLIARVALNSGHETWTPSAALSEQTDPEARFLRALTLMQWGQPVAPSSEPSPISSAACLQVEALVAEITEDEQASRRLQKAAEHVEKAVIRPGREYLEEGERTVVEAVAKRRTTEAVAWSDWRSVMERTTRDAPGGLRYLNARLRSFKTDTFTAVVRALIAVLPEENASAWSSEAIYLALEGQLQTQLEPFIQGAHGGPPIPEPVVEKAYTELVTAVVQRCQRADGETVLKGFVPFIDGRVLRTRIKWQAQGEIRRLTFEVLTKGLFGLSKNMDTGNTQLLRLMMVIPRLRSLAFAKPSKFLVKKFYESGAFEKHLAKDPSGDGYLVFALATELFTPQGRHADVDGGKLLLLAQRYALALGDELSDAEWNALRLGPRPKRPKTDLPVAPMSAHFTPTALHLLASISLEEELGHHGFLERLKAAVGLERRTYAARALMRPHERLVALKDMGQHVQRLLDTGTLTAAEVAELEATRDRYQEEGIQLAWARLEALAGRRAGVGASGDMFDVDEAIPPMHTIRQLVVILLGRALQLLPTAPDEGLELLTNARERLLQLGHKDHPDPTDVVAWYQVRRGDADAAEREANKLVEIAKAIRVVGGDEVRRADKALSQASCTLAYVAVLRGDLAKAKAIRAEAEARGTRQANADRWALLKKQLGE